MRMDSKNIIKNFKQHKVPLLRGIEQGDVFMYWLFLHQYTISRANER